MSGNAGPAQPKKRRKYKKKRATSYANTGKILAHHREDSQTNLLTIEHDDSAHATTMKMQS